MNYYTISKKPQKAQDNVLKKDDRDEKSDKTTY